MFVVPNVICKHCLIQQVDGINADSSKLKEKHVEFEEPITAKEAELNEHWKQLSAKVKIHGLL